MAKSDSQEISSQPEAPRAFDQTLEEFCTQLSVTDRSVEMIGAFYASEKQAGRFKDLASSYSARYAAFKNQPA